MSKNLKEQVTKQILDSIEKGVKPWECPWVNGMPTNYSTDRQYRGINILLLWIAKAKNEFKSNYWMTFNQTSEIGGRIAKGSKATKICFYSIVKKELSDGTETEYPFMKWSNVFNLDQIEEIEDEKLLEEGIRDFNRPEADLLVQNSGAHIRVNGVSAYYNRKDDFINMPDASFKTIEGYYSTLLHELVHWTGHSSRLEREFGKRFGSEAYAFEELVAEMGSAFLCQSFGFESDLGGHASYIQNWVQILKEDEQAIFTAANKAWEAYDFLHQKVNGDSKTHEAVA